VTSHPEQQSPLIPSPTYPTCAEAYATSISQYATLAHTFNPFPPFSGTAKVALTRLAAPGGLTSGVVVVPMTDRADAWLCRRISGSLAQCIESTH
jgi:hypothetical protein